MAGLSAAATTSSSMSRISEEVSFEQTAELVLRGDPSPHSTGSPDDQVYQPTHTHVISHTCLLCYVMLPTLPFLSHPPTNQPTDQSPHHLISSSHHLIIVVAFEGIHSNSSRTITINTITLH
jgi:hypothetical protein